MFKKLLALSFFSFRLATSFAQDQADSDRPAIHGMVIFGNTKIYAYHLPMFHPPHHYQIILEIELDEATKKKWRKDQRENPQHITYTIEPEKFILTEIVAKPRPFTVNVYRGHFERGGLKVAEKSTATIKQIIYFKKLETGSARSSTAEYILFGNDVEQFALHQLSSPADFDQIIRVEAPLVKKFQTATFASTNMPLGVSGNSLKLINEGKKVQVSLLHQIYLEFDDLRKQ